MSVMERCCWRAVDWVGAPFLLPPSPALYHSAILRSTAVLDHHCTANRRVKKND